MMSSLEQKKEEKLRKLRQFDAKSSNIFKDVESFQKKYNKALTKLKLHGTQENKHLIFLQAKIWNRAKVSQQKH